MDANLATVVSAASTYPQSSFTLLSLPTAWSLHSSAPVSWPLYTQGEEPSGICRPQEELQRRGPGQCSKPPVYSVPARLAHVIGTCNTGALLGVLAKLGTLKKVFQKYVGWVSGCGGLLVSMIPGQRSSQWWLERGSCWRTISIDIGQTVSMLLLHWPH